METSTKRVGVVLLVGAIILFAIIAMGIHYSRTGRLLPTGNELRRDANIASQRAENGLNGAGNAINNGLNGAGAAVNNGLNGAGAAVNNSMPRTDGTMNGTAVTPFPMQTMMPYAETLR